MKKNKKKQSLLKPTIIVLAFIAFFIATYFSDYGLIWEHENAHKQISSQFGCINSTINVSLWRLSGTHDCEEYYDNRTIEWILKERELHSINEVFTYNLSALAFRIEMCAYFIAFILVILFTKERRE